MSSQTTYLISGTTRGIGRGLVKSLLARPNTTVIAGVRDTQAETALALNDLPKANGSNIILIKIDASIETDPQDAIATLRKAHNITSLDTAIANAGILDPTDFQLSGSISPQAFRQHFEINTLAAITLFQASLPLLQKSSSSPKFIVTTSSIGSNIVAKTLGAPVNAYGVSKAAINYFVNKASGEYPEIKFGLIHPGLVETDMSKPFVEMTGGKIPAISVEESVRGYLERVDGVGEEEEGSVRFLQYDGEELPW